jgi:probable rRNA maturation factor
MDVDVQLVVMVKRAIQELNPSLRLKKIDVHGCSDEELLVINKEHLNLDYSRGDRISGELFISLDRVKDNAQALGVTYSSELRRVVAHGILHLTGLKDKTEEEIKVMRHKEDEVLAYLENYGS